MSLKNDKCAITYIFIILTLYSISSYNMSHRHGGMLVVNTRLLM